MNRLTRNFACLSVALVSALGRPLSAAEPISDFTSTEAVGVAMTGVPACLEWCAIGLCYWLRCTPFGCSMETSLRITHNYPDLVVTSWTSDMAGGVGGNPYIDADAIYGSVTYALGSSTYSVLGGVMLGGGNSTPKDRPAVNPPRGNASSTTELSSRGETAKPNEQRHRNLRFKSTMAVGHPIDAINSGAIMGEFSSIPALCPSEANAFQLYYSSEADAINWRTGFTDMLEIGAYIPGISEVGIPGVNDYGNIYPRTGFLVQHSDYRSGAVTAQRTVDIVTKPAQLHIYSQLDPVAYPTWASPPPGPSIALTDKWQMISPLPEAFCHPFGVEPEVGNNSTEGTYGWNYWQNYECCINDPGAIFLFPTYFNLFCLAL